MRIYNLGAIIEDNLRADMIRSSLNNHGKGERLLDLGCGKKPYKDIYQNFCTKSYGADLPYSPFPKQEIDVYCNVSAIPFQNNSFATVLSSEVMQDAPEPSRMLKEIYRVLKPGGLLLLSTPFVAPIVDGKYDHYHYTEHGLRHLLKKEGFNPISIFNVSDLLGATLTLMIKPFLKFWSIMSKKIKLDILYSIYNPFIFLFVFLPQIMYLYLNSLSKRMSLISKLLNSFSYGAIGYLSVAIKPNVENL